MHWLDAGPFWLRLVGGFGAAVLTWLAAIDMGWLIVDRVAPLSGRLARAAFGAVLGYALLGTVVGIAALLHLARPAVVVALPPVVIAVRIPHYVQIWRSATSVLASSTQVLKELSVVERYAAVVVLFAIITALIAAALPAVWWDTIAYHLPIAAGGLASGTLPFDAGRTQTGFPLLGESAALPAFALAGSAGAAFVTLGAGIVLVMLCGAICARFEPRAGWLAAALLASTPLWIWLVPSFYVDIPFAMLAVAALGAPLVFGADAAALPVVGALAGAFAGGAAAVKVPGLTLALVGAIVACAVARARWSYALGAFAMGFIAFAAPWYARSLVLTGDPIYPFLTAWNTGSPLHAFAARYVTMTRDWCGGGYGLGDAVLAPVRLLVDPLRYCGDPGFALRLGSVLFIAAALVVKKTRALAAITVVLTALWFAQDHQGRFLVTAAAFYSVVVALGAVGISDRLSAAASAIVLTLGLVNVLANWLPSLERLASNSLVPAYAYMAGKQSADDYLGARLETYAAAQWLKGRGGRALALDDVRDYYFGANVVWGNPYYQPVWTLDWHASPKDRYALLRRAGFEFMVVNANRAYVNRTPTGIDWGGLQHDERVGVIRRAFAANDVVVYELGGPRDARSATSKP